MVRGKLKKIKFRQELFWDVDPKTIDPQKHAEYIIERILDFGRDEEVRWMRHFYPRVIVKKTLDGSRVLHNKTKVLWQLLLKN
jgi:alkyl sulfatase BDS1-like metallo-beta-lactamase superfamily hydrolase